MRLWTMAIAGLVACGDKEEDTGSPPDDTEEPPLVETAEPNTDTGGGDFEFIPRYYSVDAHFGVDSNGLVSSVLDPAYGYTIDPYLVIYIGSAEWEPGDWGDSDNLCTIAVDATGATPGGAWVAERGLWYGFDVPADAPAFGSSCDDLQDAGYDPYVIAAEHAWSIGIGPIQPPWQTYYSGYTNFFGGYAGSALDPAPDDDDGLNSFAYAYAVDPATMSLVLEYGDYTYYTDVEAATVPLAEGGVAPAFYHVISYYILDI